MFLAYYKWFESVNNDIKIQIQTFELTKPLYSKQKMPKSKCFVLKSVLNLNSGQSWIIVENFIVYDTIKMINKGVFYMTTPVELQNKYIEKFANKIKEIIEKAKPDEIKRYDLHPGYEDDTGIRVLMKDKTPILHMKSIGMPGTMNYSFTINSNPVVRFEGDEDTLKDLINLMTGKYEYAPEEYKIDLSYLSSWQAGDLTEKDYEQALLSLNSL